MAFETKKDVLEWFETQERSLTPEFISAIPWKDVANYEFDRRFVPVLLYMRDVETLTDMYHREMLRTPTGRDPYISKFMERWGVEEIDHGMVINRFLNELGCESDDSWPETVRRSVSAAYRSNTYFLTTLTNLIGSQFTATHMTFGAINEMTTGQAYRRLMGLADHPVLTHILKAIIREESIHTHFYASIARIELARKRFPRRLARFVIDNFWEPVGRGALGHDRTHYLISTLFGRAPGLEILDTTVTKRVQHLPGFSGITTINDTLRGIVEELTPAEAAA